ncbi:MAG: MBL fold metallo-hydrolase [Anaerolineae bacterium]
MKITFHGAAHTVTGSQHLIEVNGKRILLDCGLYQGKRDESRTRNRTLPFDPASLDAVVLSHAHIDHSGNIPNLVKSGFDGDIFCTAATRDLCAAMLRDSGHIQERDAEYVNKKHRRRGEPLVEPIYTEEDALKSLDYLLGIRYERPRELIPGVYVTLYDAGHMLGSAIVALDIEDHEAKRDVRLVFSGDIGRRGTPILRDPTFLKEADVLIMESTYGGRTHPPLDDSVRDLEAIILRTYRRGGKVIIPAFAVGRTQQIVYELNQLIHARDIPPLPVFVDSPLAVNVTDIFRLHPEAFDEEAMRYMAHEDPDGDLFGFSTLRYIRQVSESKDLNFLREPCVIISASGMIEHGRILHHVKNNIGDKRSTILIVGWQAPNTLGRYLVEGKSPVRIFGEEYKVKAEVEVLNGFSGHADHGELLEWVGHFNRRPEHIFLVHGEPDAADALAKGLRSDLGYEKVHIPELHQSFDV